MFFIVILNNIYILNFYFIFLDFALFFLDFTLFFLDFALFFLILPPPDTLLSLSSKWHFDLIALTLSNLGSVSEAHIILISLLDDSGILPSVYGHILCIVGMLELGR